MVIPIVSLCIAWENRRGFPTKQEMMMSEAWKGAMREDAANEREYVLTLA
jgi:hypothetical protein